MTGTPNGFFQPAGGNNATALFVVNENNTEAGDFQPRNFIAVEASNTDHSAHFAGYKSRGTYANPIPVVASDFMASLVPWGYINGNYQSGGYYTHIVDDVSSGDLTSHAEIAAVTNGSQGWPLYRADTTTTRINGALVVSDPGNQPGQPGAVGYATVTLFGSQSGDVTSGWGIFAGYPNPGDFSIRERNVNTYLTIHKTVGDVIIWLGKLLFGGTTSGFPALKRSGTTLQARLADDSAFASIQGKLTTDTPFSNGHLILYDSTGRAYNVNASPA